MENSLRKAREEARTRDLKSEDSALKLSINNLRTKREQFESELAEKPAPTEVDLRAMRMDGFFELITTFLLIAVMTWLIRLSLMAFLPQSDFPPLWQWIVAEGFILGSVLCFHLWLRRNPDGTLLIPRSFLAISITCLIGGFLLLAIIRGFLVGPIDHTTETLTKLDLWSRWLGVSCFCLLGLGLDIIAGIGGASAWRKLTYSLPLLKWYRKRDELEMEVTKSEMRLAQIRSEIGDGIEIAPEETAFLIKPAA